MKFPFSATAHRTCHLVLWVSASALLPRIAFAQTAPEAVKVENSAMTGELLYEILLGELNVRQGESVAGFSLLLDAARKSNDVQLYTRAVDIALQARSGDGALMAARAWSQAYPNDRKANDRLLQILLALNQVGDSLEPLKKELALAPSVERPVAIGLIPRHYARVSDKKAALDVVHKALTPYLSNPATAGAAWTSLGRLQLATDDTAAALTSLRKGHEADPASLGPALLALEMMGRKVNEAEAFVTRALRQQNSPELAMAYARVLIELQRYADANTQLLEVTQRYPQYTDAWLLLGSLQYEQGQDKQAEASLARYVSMASQDTSENNARGVAQAQTRRAELLARQGKLNEARALLAQIPTRNAEEARNRLLAEVQLLREHRQWQAAFDVLNKASNDEPDLLYEQAMLAEKLNQLEVMETLLRRVLALEPAHYNAYNALGFSLADRNLRLGEAKQLITQALALAPNDPFITDSLGWVEFRLGNMAEALSLLQKAYQGRADAEIAAHLGEVLWRLNRPDEARQIWREAVKAAPQNETLQETLQRLKPGL